MPDFSTIVQDPKVRAIVQDGILERKFYDGLFPALLFRSECDQDDFPLQVGDAMTFTGSGLMATSTQPITPGQDLPVGDYGMEQWDVSINKFGRAIDSDMPTSVAAAASLFLRNAHTVGLNGGQTMNKICRNVMFNAAMSGWTVCDGAQTAVTTLRVKRLNGLTKARNASLAGASQVKYSSVSATNPLAITIKSSTDLSRNVIGFTPDTPGDEVGPGTVTLSAAATVADRDPVLATDRTNTVFVGGGNAVDAIGSNDILKLSDARSLIARMRDVNAPAHDDGFFHIHVDPIGESQIQADAEWRTLFTAMPNDYRFAQFAIGRAAGATWFRNTEAPKPETVVGGTKASYSTDDNFGGELFSSGATTGVKVHRALCTGKGGCKEYTQKIEEQITEAGITGKMGRFSINNNGISVLTDRISLVIRAPIDRAQEKVSTGWKWVGNFVFRTDGATGDSARYKRVGCIAFGE